MINKIKLNYTALTKKERIIADYYLQHPNKIISMNIHDMAGQLNVSSASITRFCHDILNMTFADSKIELAKSLPHVEQKTSNEMLKWATNYSDVPDRLVASINEVLNSVMAINDVEDLEKCVSLISKCRMVYFFGVGNSGIVAQDFQQKLSKLGIVSTYIIDGSFGLLNSSNCGKEDLAIFISYTGKTISVLEAMRNVKRSGAKIISITSNSKNKMRGMADIPLLIPSVENSTRLSAILSRYCELFITDTIFIGLAKKVTDDPEKMIQDYSRILSIIKEK